MSWLDAPDGRIADHVALHAAHLHLDRWTLLEKMRAGTLAIERRPHGYGVLQPETNDAPALLMFIWTDSLHRRKLHGRTLLRECIDAHARRHRLRVLCDKSGRRWLTELDFRIESTRGELRVMVDASLPRTKRRPAPARRPRARIAG